MEILPSKGKFGIDKFINYLSIHYSWIADSIKCYIENEEMSSLTEKIQLALTTGEVPRLSLTHVTRTDHVCYLLLISVINYIITYV